MLGCLVRNQKLFSLVWRRDLTQSQGYSMPTVYMLSYNAMFNIREPTSGKLSLSLWVRDNTDHDDVTRSYAICSFLYVDRYEMYGSMRPTKCYVEIARDGHVKTTRYATTPRSKLQNIPVHNSKVDFYL